MGQPERIPAGSRRCLYPARPLERTVDFSHPFGIEQDSALGDAAVNVMEPQAWTIDVQQETDFASAVRSPISPLDQSVRSNPSRLDAGGRRILPERLPLEAWRD